MDVILAKHSSPGEEQLSTDNSSPGQLDLPMQAKVDYELWKDPDELEVTVSSSNAAKPETTEASQNGAYSKHKHNGSHSRVLSEQGGSLCNPEPNKDHTAASCRSC